MKSGIDILIKKAYFISQIVDMEQLIVDLMAADNVSEKELKPRCSPPHLGKKYHGITSAMSACISQRP